MRKWLYWGIPLLIVVSLIVTMRVVVQQGLQIWALARVQQLVSEHSPVDMASEGLEISWLPLKVSLKNVRVRAKDPEALGFSMATAGLVQARVDAFHLITGKISLSVVLLESLDLQMILDPHLKGSGPVPEIPWDQIFAMTDTLPVRSVAVRDSHLKLFSKKHDFEIEVQSLAARLTARSGKISLEAQTGDSVVRYKNLTSDWVLGVQAVATPETLEVTQFRLSSSKQSIDASGVFTNTRNLLRSPTAQLKLSVKADLPEIFQALPPNLKLPHVEGSLDFDASLEVRGRKLPVGNFRVQTKGIRIHHSEVGDVTTSGMFDGRQLLIPQLNVSHSAGTALAKNIRADFGEGNSFDSLSIKTQVTTQDLSLHRLLSGIGVGELPLELLMTADLDCGDRKSVV